MSLLNLKILISSGSNKFHFNTQKKELYKNKKNEINIFTSAYPKDYEVKLINLLIF